MKYKQQRRRTHPLTPDEETTLLALHEQRWNLEPAAYQALFETLDREFHWRERYTALAEQHGPRELPLFEREMVGPLRKQLMRVGVLDPHDDALVERAARALSWRRLTALPEFDPFRRLSVRYPADNAYRERIIQAVLMADELEGIGLRLERLDPKPLTPPAVASDAPRKIAREEANERVADYLRQQASGGDPFSLTRDQVSAATGVSKGGVSNTPAWKAFCTKRNALRKPGARNIPLTDYLQTILPDDLAESPEMAELLEKRSPRPYGPLKEPRTE